MENKSIINLLLVIPVDYKTLIQDLQERTGKGTSFAKQLCKVWIEKKLIIKNNENLYAKGF
jgi:hypothetical protein